MEINSMEEYKSDDPVKELAKEIKVIVPGPLDSPDALVVAAKKVLTEKDKYINHGTVRTYRDVLDISVSRAGITRALLLMDMLVKGLRVRGHGIIFKNGETFAKVKGQDLQVKLREQTKRMKGKDGWSEYEPTGTFYFKIDRHPDKEFKDRSRKLEEKMGEIIAWMEIQADRDNKRDEEWRREAEAEKVEEERLRAVEAEREAEMGRFRELVSEAERWRTAGLIREYVGVRAALGADRITAEDGQSNSTESQEGLERWVEWAGRKADWVDPVVQGEDGVLGRFGYRQNNVEG